MAQCFISWVAPDMTTILKARDKRLKEQSEVGKTRLLGLATPSSRAVVEGRIGSAAAPKAAAGEITAPRDPLMTAAT